MKPGEYEYLLSENYRAQGSLEEAALWGRRARDKGWGVPMAWVKTEKNLRGVMGGKLKYLWWVQAVAEFVGDEPEDVWDELLMRSQAWMDVAKRTERIKRIQKVWERRSPLVRYREVLDPYLEGFDYTWVPAMAVGEGTKVHLAPGELPGDKRLLVKVSTEYLYVEDGVVYHWDDPRRGGKRAVYGWWE